MRASDYKMARRLTRFKEFSSAGLVFVAIVATTKTEMLINYPRNDQKHGRFSFSVVSPVVCAFSMQWLSK